MSSREVHTLWNREAGNSYRIIRWPNYAPYWFTLLERVSMAKDQIRARTHCTSISQGISPSLKTHKG